MKQFVVIGNPVDHSLSPIIHQLFAKQTGVELSYETLLAPLDGFSATVTQFIERGGYGANVTLPFKEQAFEIATKKSQAAIDARAVNTLVFHDEGLVEGCNTDGMGLIQDLTHNHHYSIRQKRILVIGAGGAVRGIVAPLLEQAPASLTIANRTKQKAVMLAEQFELLGKVTASGLDELDRGPYDLVIHGTSVRDDELAYASSWVGPGSWCYDLNYAAGRQTDFVTWARQQQVAQALDGLGMLVEQAAASFYIWHGVYPDTAPVIAALS